MAALAQNADYAPSQAWSRYFYDREEVYSRVDGLVYANAHNHDHALALYERARDAVTCPEDNIIRLDDP